MGLLLGFSVELGVIWPAVVLHFTTNVLVDLRVVGGVWLGLALFAVAAVALAAFVPPGVLGLQRRVDLPRRPRHGLSLDRQWRLTRRFGPLVCQAPFFSRPVTWIDDQVFADWPSVDMPRWWPRRGQSALRFRRRAGEPEGRRPDG
jgi:hypothetical protein